MVKQTSSSKTSWKDNVVLVAKNTYVWLNQLSRKYQRPISRIDQIPEDEFVEMTSRGFNALWLVGVWQRSPASQKIKRLYGREHAIASAYSIYEYRIAQNLGGEEALQKLNTMAEKHNIRLACDMVPNHTGLDAPWIFQHPDWYISVKSNPVNDFSFNSTNLSNNPVAGIYLDEGYYNQTRAAEVFKYERKGDGEVLYIYHGNDGTSMPWNDTAQLNYLNAETRQAVMEEIISVARRFKVIRLDAAMTLVRKHFKRLWFPYPGGKKFIPTRGNNNMSDEEFDRLMPREFWSEVIEEIAIQAPDTLLIAEAFWLMEKYFINELGMHRVYNSAFMHQLRDEKNQEFRQYLSEILQSDPSMLERFVNFLTTPDERTALDQFGKTDKYFGACRLLACLPGLPMFGHGQWEGFSERYGMDINCPMMAEEPDQALMDKHNRLIAPLLKQRKSFASVENFRLFDVIQSDRSIIEDVIAFGNQAEGQNFLVIFNNSRVALQGSIRKSISQINPSHPEKPGQRISIQEWLNINGNSETKIELTSLNSHEPWILPVEEIDESGIPLDLGPYESRIYSIQIA